MILTAICTLADQRQQNRTACYFHWYEKAVDAELEDRAALRILYGGCVVPEEFHKAASSIGIFVFYAWKFSGL